MLPVSVGGKSAAVCNHSRFYLKLSIMMTYAFVAVLLLSSLHAACMRFFLRMGRRKIRIGKRHKYTDQTKRKPLSLMVSIPHCNLAMQVSTGLSLVQCSPQPMRSQFHCDSDAVSASIYYLWPHACKFTLCREKTVQTCYMKQLTISRDS